MIQLRRGGGGGSKASSRGRLSLRKILIGVGVAGVAYALALVAVLSSSGGRRRSEAGDGERRYHVVFSTDCSPYQRWQSYVLFHSAMTVRQPGRVTRIASGCSQDDAKLEQEWHDAHIRDAMSPHFGLHLTPRFSSVKNDEGQDTGQNYEFFNKPFGVRHWLEHGDGVGRTDNTSSSTTLLDEDVIVIIIDPDMVLLRPILADFSDPTSHVAHPVDSKRPRQPTVASHGYPFAQTYGLGSYWTTLDLKTITGTPHSPALRVSRTDALDSYPVGPPYIATARDMYRIAKSWTDFVPKVHAQYPNLLAEMYAYCVAAAHLQLPHRLIDSLMISNTEVDQGEGWPLLEHIPDVDMCSFAVHVHHMEKQQPRYQHVTLPNVVHYCQRYMLGKWFFGKRRVPHDFFSCESDLMVMPPMEVATQYDYRIPPPPGEKKQVRPKQRKREAFMICFLTQVMNDAAEFYKNTHCDNDDKTVTPNRERSLLLWELPY